MKISNKKFCRLTGLLGTILILSVVAACSGTYGIYRAGADKARVFNSIDRIDDYNYYYTGSNVHPDAVLAVHKSYTLTSEELWNKKDVSAKEGHAWAKSMRRGFSYILLTPDGKEIGFMSTSWNPGPLKIESENRVSVYLPTPEFYIGISKE